MTTFCYRAITQHGKKVKGAVEALHLEEAKAQLKEQKLIPTFLSEKKLIFQSKQQRLKGEALITFTSQLSNLLTAGMPLYESLLSIAEESKKEAFHPILLNLTEQIKTGASLSEAMKSYPSSFNTLYRSMIQGGETTGALDQTLEKLCSLLERQNRLKKQLITALIYPLVLCTFSFALIFLLFTFVIPSLETLFVDRNVNRFTQLVIQTSHFLTKKWPIYLPFLAIVGYGGFYLFKKERVRLKWHYLLLKLPLVKTIIIQKEVARFTRAMGTMLAGGVSIIDAMQISRGVMSSPLLQDELKKGELRIVEGSLLSRELKKSEWFPPLVARMLSIGEEGGKMGDMLCKIATLYEDELEKSLTRLTTLAQPVVLIIMGGVVGIIMMAVLLPLTDVTAFL